MQYEDLRTIKQLAASNPAFTEGSLRWLVFNASSNGLADAVVRVTDSQRPKVLINVPVFNRWLESRRMVDRKP